MERIKQLSEWSNRKFSKALEDFPEDDALRHYFHEAAFALNNFERQYERLTQNVYEKTKETV